MKRHFIAAAAAATFAGGAHAQAPTPGTYVFVSGPGVGTPPFTVTGFTTSLGGMVMLAHPPNCAGIHVHGTFNGFADPNAGGCGHGIIQLLVGPPGSGSLPGGTPTNVAGHLALTAPPNLVSRPLTDGDSLELAASILSFGLDHDPARVLAGLLPPEVIPQLPAPSAPLPANAVSETLADPAQRALTAPDFTSFLEQLAAYDDEAAEGYRRDAEKTREQAEQWRRLAEDARRDAERNRQRADEARRDGREADARNWEEEAERDERHARERDAQADRLDAWSDEARERESAARRQAEERREAAERARDRARQAERERSERARKEAEEKARALREEREARRAKEAAEREARARERAEKERARQAQAERERRAAQRAHEQRLADEEAQRNQRARGGTSETDLRVAAGLKQQAEKEEQSLLDRIGEAIYGFFESHGDKVKDKLQDKMKDEILERSGLKDAAETALDNLGLGKAAGALGEGVDQLKAVKKLADSMQAELERRPHVRRRIESRIEALSDPRSTSRTTLMSGSIYKDELFGTVSRMVEANR